MSELKSVPSRTVSEWDVRSDYSYSEPFVDVQVDAAFTAPSGKVYTMPGFYDGEGTWRVRFCPGEVGRWVVRIGARPENLDLAKTSTFEVVPSDTRGALRATPGEAWGFHFESGEPAFLLGDTAYNLFGMAHCGGDVEGFLRRRAEQSFDVLRVRCQVSPFHPPEGYNEWQTRRTWPWGGSEQSPRFGRFNLDWFRTVDRVVQTAEALDIGFEMIMEAWGFEFPFNNRAVFVPEWEEVWLRYLVARYDAYNSVYFWTLMNEYEFYPDGDWRYNPVADRWAMRIARWVKTLAPHGHVISVHNGPRQPPFARRFAADPGAVDAIMFQEWGSRGKDDGWLAAGIEEQIVQSFERWPGSALFVEYGYERSPELPLTFPGFDYCDGSHTRRGAWRGACCAMGVMNGFENTWGPVMNLEQDQEGVDHLRRLKDFFTRIVPFERLQVAHDLVLSEKTVRGHKPLALASASRTLVVVYLPAGGTVMLDLPVDKAFSQAQWYDPRTGHLMDVAEKDRVTGEQLSFVAPDRTDAAGWPLDWVLVLKDLP